MPPHDLVWFGEIHGIKENYKTYKTLIPRLAAYGFKNVLWEMPSDFSKESHSAEDGRINQFSINFLEWLQNQVKIGVLDNLALFGNRKSENESNTVDYEKTMALEMLNIISNDKSKKYVVITGNYHMQKSKEENDNKRCIDYLKEKTKLKILAIEISYAGGTFYNYGLKKLPALSKAEDIKIEELEFNSIGQNTHTFKLNIGKAHAVLKNLKK